MTGAALASGAQLRNLPSGTLKASGALWFVVALAGQWAFFYYIAGFYGVSTFTGNLEVWNRLEAFGRTPYVAGDTGGNLAFAAHALGAGIVSLGGALQLIPQIRRHAPTFHRWNGRVFLLTVTGLSLSGFYLVWIRGTSPTQLDAIATSINGALILGFAALALRAAMARDIATHQRWAMRLYLVSNAQWFLRIGFFSYFIFATMLGVEASPEDPFLRFWTFACFLAPIAVLQLYFLARDRGGAIARVATAAGLLVLTVAMAVGILGFAVFSHAMVTGAPLELPG